MKRYIMCIAAEGHRFESTPGHCVATLIGVGQFYGSFSNIGFYRCPLPFSRLATGIGAELHDCAMCSATWFPVTELLHKLLTHKCVWGRQANNLSSYSLWRICMTWSKPIVTSSCALWIKSSKNLQRLIYSTINFTVTISFEFLQRRKCLNERVCNVD